MAQLVDIILPSDSQEGTTATLTAWLRKPGDVVAEFDALADLETDKVNVEVPSPASGVLEELLKKPGDSVVPGEVMGRIRVGVASSQEALAPAAVSAPLPPAALARQTADERLSPAVRRLLAENQLSPLHITGSGRDGRITKQDVLEHLAAGKHEDVRQTAVPAPVQAPIVRAPSAPGAGSNFVPHNGMRKSIASHMVTSLLQTAPHVTAVFEMDMTAVQRHRAAHKDRFAAEGVPLTFTAYFLMATVEAMRAVPEINSRWHDDGLEIFSDINIGVGTALGNKGLIVPVIRQVQNLGLRGVAARLGELTELARQSKLKPSDIQGGTFTISNHGVSGSLIATPIIINQPQSAILGIGKLQKRVVVVERDGEDCIQIRPMCYVTLSIDHRALDAWHCNTFLARFVETIEGWS